MTPSSAPSSAQDALNLAAAALRDGDRRGAYQFARQAASMDPSLEKAWLILGALTKNPDASLHYLQIAARINPENPQAQKGIQWALNRKQKWAAQAEKTGPVRTPPEPVKTGITAKIQVIKPIPAPKPLTPPLKRPPKKRALRALLLAGLGGGVILCLAMGFWLAFSQNWVVLAGGNSIEKPAGALQKPSLTPSATSTSTATVTTMPTETATPLPTETPTVTPSETPTETPSSIPTQIPTEAPPLPILDYNSGGERWVEVNLSQQMLYAYEGDQIVNSFVISSGTTLYPTITGDFNIYAMYRYSTMSGEDYYLPDVPFAMYFYKGYALHGTYWHNNFGTPMSHGCVNLRTADAGWLFNWVSIGTLVSVHY